MPLTFGSLFAGIGGLDLGLERAGMECRWQVEIDDYATRVLERHWPDVPRFRDVRDCGAANLERADLICGGFPCQDVSLAGQRAGLAGKRTTLWSEFSRIICEVGPRWVLAENVPGLLSSDSGRFFGRVLRDLAESGYDAEWDCIPAAAVGAPHRRDRVFIVAHTNRARQLQPQGCEQDQRGWTGNSGANVANTQGGQPREQNNKSRRESLGARGGNSGRNEESCDREVLVYPSGFDGKRPVYERDTTGQSKETPRNRGCPSPNTDGPRLAFWQNKERLWQFTSSVGARQWATEPSVGRVAHGVPRRVDRLRGLGNAVVPQVAEFLGRMIVAADARGR